MNVIGVNPIYFIFCSVPSKILGPCLFTDVYKGGFGQCSQPFGYTVCMKLKRGGIKQKSTAWNNHQLPALEHPVLPKVHAELLRWYT